MTSSNDNDDDDDSSSSSSSASQIGPIVGGVVGGVIALAAVVVFVYARAKRSGSSKGKVNYQFDNPLYEDDVVV